METAKLVLKSMVSRIQTPEYSTLLNDALEAFRKDLEDGHKFLAELQEAQSEEELNAWGAKYTQWQANTVEGKALKRRLAEHRPRDRSLLKIHDGLVILMNNRNIELSQTFNMFLRTMGGNHPGANQARDAADKATRDGDAALDYCRKQLAKLQSEHPALLESLHLPDWVMEM